jgi:hypothetical protein
VKINVAMYVLVAIHTKRSCQCSEIGGEDITKKQSIDSPFMYIVFRRTGCVMCCNCCNRFLNMNDNSYIHVPEIVLHIAR